MIPPCCRTPTTIAWLGLASNGARDPFQTMRDRVDQHATQLPRNNPPWEIAGDIDRLARADGVGNDPRTPDRRQVNGSLARGKRLSKHALAQSIQPVKSSRTR